ncbi:MAG: hypothetical protein H7281_19825 [Bacteriovorax sp.]|nr:hypothetical protein [Bacteriovorax sp.]
MKLNLIFSLILVASSSFLATSAFSQVLPQCKPGLMSSTKYAQEAGVQIRKDLNNLFFGHRESRDLSGKRFHAAPP